MNVVVLSTVAAATAANGPSVRPSRSRAMDVLKRTKNGYSFRADGVSIGPRALDREKGTIQRSVPSRHSARCLQCVPRRRQRAQNSILPVLLTPLLDRWDRPRSPAVAGRLLLWLTALNSVQGLLFWVDDVWSVSVYTNKQLFWTTTQCIRLRVMFNQLEHDA